MEQQKIITPNNYTVFVTALLPEYATTLVNGMLKKGYLIGSALNEGAFYYGRSEGQSFLVTFFVYKPQVELSPKIINDDLMDIINTEKMSIYSAIVSERAEASITGSNFNSPDQPTSDHILTSEELKKMN